MKNTSWGAIQIDDGESIQYLELPFSNVRLPFEINATIEPIQFEIMLDGKPHKHNRNEARKMPRMRSSALDRTRGNAFVAST